MKTPRCRRVILLLLATSLYVTAYFASSTLIRAEGSVGGFAGPKLTRLLPSENYLVVFYPVYLAERIIRNRSLARASYEFNCDFVDQKYERTYLYGGGKYSKIWYDF